MTCGWLLHRQHDIHVFEAGSYVGGHTNTVDFEIDGADYSVDTGFIVCNDRTYPNFLRLIDSLGVERVPCPMTFSVRCDAANLEYCGSGLRGMFSQRRNILRPSFLRMMKDILRFNREGESDAQTVPLDMTVGEYLNENRYGSWFIDYYLLPMGAAIWSCPTGTFRDFPIRFILEFYSHHGLLSLTNRPTWYSIVGGSKNYVSKLTKPFADTIRLRTPVLRVDRHEDEVVVTSSDGMESFDEVIFACHADQALSLIGAATAEESEILSAFPYQPNEAVLHTDASVLPTRRSTWSSWNYRIADAGADHATLTYDMNQLQHLPGPHQICVSLNEVQNIDGSRVIGRYRYSHPVFSVGRAEAQRRHSELIRSNRTSFCGAYWGNGFHEDGVSSGLAVCRKFGAADILDTELSQAEAASFHSVGR